MEEKNLRINSKENELKWASIALIFKDKGYKCIVAGYEGSGDSGGIEYIHATKDDFQTACDIADSWNYQGNRASIDEVTDEVSFVESTIVFLLDDIEDWYNNDGGFGTVVMDIINNRYLINNNVRYTNHENFQHDGKIIDETPV